MVATLAPAAPPAHNLRSPKVGADSVDALRIMKRSLKAKELALMGIDDFLISGGIRLILFLPIIVVVLFGLAQSYRGSDP